VGQHFSLLRTGRHPNKLLQRAWAVHGASAFTFEVLQIVKAQEQLADAEAAWMHRLRSREPSNGYNLAPVPGDLAAAEGTRKVRLNEPDISMSAAGRFMDEALGIPREATIRRVVDGLAVPDFDDIRPAHFTVFQHMPPEGIRLTALADAALMTKQSMGYLVDELEARGYVERAADPADRRAKVVRLTERGRAVDEAVRQVIERLEVAWAARLGADEYRELTRLLRALIAMLEQSAHGA
jgi:DNA-binding MarR family transcriptional regulator